MGPSVKFVLAIIDSISKKKWGLIFFRKIGHEGKYFPKFLLSLVSFVTCAEIFFLFQSYYYSITRLNYYSTHSCDDYQTKFKWTSVEILVINTWYKMRKEHQTKDDCYCLNRQNVIKSHAWNVDGQTQRRCSGRPPTSEEASRSWKIQLKVEPRKFS